MILMSGQREWPTPPVKHSLSDAGEGKPYQILPSSNLLPPSQLLFDHDEVPVLSGASDQERLEQAWRLAAGLIPHQLSVPGQKLPC